MQFRDLFVPRWQHSNPKVRKKAAALSKNGKLLAHIAEKDPDPSVRETASARLVILEEEV